MKKVILLALLCFAVKGISQETATTESGKVVILNKNGTYKIVPQPAKKQLTYLFEKDFKKSGDNMVILGKKINITVAEDDPATVNLDFMASQERFTATKIDLINEMLGKASIEVLGRMKNKYTYVPKKILFTYSDDFKKWLISIDYTSQNDYGATKNGTAVCKMTLDGFVYDVDML